jgi:hypothetical protein
MIIYEKMQLIQGKTVETHFFFFNSAFIKCNMYYTQLVEVPRPTPPHRLRSICEAVDDVREPREGIKINASLHSRDRVIPRGSTRPL